MKFFSLVLLAGTLAETVTVTSTRDWRAATTANYNGGGTVVVTSTRYRTTDTSETDSESSSAQTTAVTSCHLHDDTLYCIDGEGVEGSIVPAPTNTEDVPSEYTGCHSHDEDVYCLDESGDEVQFVAEASTTSSSSLSGLNCHYHAGVEHCVGDDEEETSCERTDRDYNIPLRIGLLFVILVTSAIGSFGPMCLKGLFKLNLEGGLVMIIINNFSIGVILSTALVHLLAHAAMMWDSSCITLSYEGTSTAITMAGIFVTFLIEFLANRLIRARQELAPADEGNEKKLEESEGKVEDSSESNSIEHVGHSHLGVLPNDKLSVMIMEAGIVFHSVLIGITTVVAGDSYFITLFIVILFHQMFEGLALGARIVCLDTSLITKIIMAAVFAVITPIGMAIGTGVLKKFNGNDPSTIIALGTLDSFSAGILIWYSMELLIQQWIVGHLLKASWGRIGVALVSLVAGLILMSVLGKWA